MQILGLIGMVGMVVCWIMVLIKMFQDNKVLLGILGIICGLVTFVWGWMNAKKYKLEKVMLIYTICWILTLVGADWSFSMGG